MTKRYQTNEIDTRALAVPERVNVVMVEVADDMREGCSLSRSAPGCR